jgi:hypothetical protein
LGPTTLSCSEIGLASFTGASSAITNSGDGEVTVGANAQVTDISSIGPVVLNDGATVEGDVVTAATVTLQPGATVTGDVQENASLSAEIVVSRTIEFPGGEDVRLQGGGRSERLAPGDYGHAELKANSQLTLSAGEYTFSSLTVDPRATLRIDSSEGAVLVFVRGTFDFKGSFHHPGSPADVFFGLFQHGTISIKSPISATIVAPNATLGFNPDHREQFTGSFFGRSVHLGPRVTISGVSFAHWGALVLPTGALECVVQFGEGSYSALFSYENPFELAVTPPRTENRFDPAQVREPPSAFEPGSGFFWVPFDGGTFAWILGQSRIEASSESPRCSEGALPAGEAIEPFSQVSPPSAAALARQVLDVLGPDRSLIPASLVLPSGSASVSSLESKGSQRLAKTASRNSRRLAKAAGPQIQALLPAEAPFVVDVERFVPDSGIILPAQGEILIDGISVFEGALNSSQTVELSIPVTRDFVVVRISLRLTNPGDFAGLDEVWAEYTIDNQTGSITEVKFLADRLEEGFVLATAKKGNESIDWGFGPRFEHTGLPDLGFSPRVCFRWNAQYLDAGFGEDHANSTSVQVLPARFASASLNITRGPEGHSWVGFLDKDGCIPHANRPPAELLLLTREPIPNAPLRIRAEVKSEMCDGAWSLDANGVPQCDTSTGSFWRVFTVTSGKSFVFPPGGGEAQVGELDAAKKTVDLLLICRIFTEDEQETSCDCDVVPRSRGAFADWRPDRSYEVPLSQINIRTVTHDDLTRVSAVVGQLLATADSGVSPGLYQVLADDGCPRERLILGACRDSTTDLLYIGPGGPNEQGPLSRWKYVVGHEAGHLVTHRGMGSLRNLYSFQDIDADGI